MSIQIFSEAQFTDNLNAAQIVRIYTDANLATVQGAGWLNPSVSEGYVLSVKNKYLISYNAGANVDFFNLAVSAGVYTLSVANTDVLLPTIANHIAVFSNTSGTLTEDPATAISGGNIQAGLSGTAGALFSYPSTASKGHLAIVAVANTGNTVTTISNAAMGQASVISIPDPAAATANFAVAPAALVNGNIIKASGTAGLVADGGVLATNVMSLAAVNQMAAAGAVLLDKSTGTVSTGAVTINKQSGVITGTFSTTAASTTTVTFNNSEIVSTSVILVSLMGGTNTIPGVQLSCAYTSAGVATLTVTNNNVAGSALSGTLIIGFVVL